MSSIRDKFTEPAPRPTRRRWGFVVLTVILLLTGWAVFRHLTTGGLTASEVETGLDRLADAVRDTEDDAALDEAETHFRKAASVSILDHRPAFLLSSTRRIAELRSGDARPESPSDRVLASLADGDIERARTELDGIGPPGDERRAFYGELVSALEARLSH